jgi:hypothetical protein
MYYKYVIYVLKMTERQKIAGIVNIFCLADKKKKGTPKFADHSSHSRTNEPQHK